MTFRRAIFAATILATPGLSASAVQAQPITGLYVGGGTGFNWQDTQRYTRLPQVESLPEAKVGYGGNLAGDAKLGYGLGNGLRFEVEGVYLHDSLGKAKFYGSSSHGSGTENSYATFVNALYDIDFGSPTVTPYLGAGVGYLWQSLSDVGLNRSDLGGTSLEGTAGSFAFQGIAGLAVPVASLPGLAFTAEYHFIGTVGSTKFDSSTSLYGFEEDGRARLSPTYDHVGLIGLRYAFDTAAPVRPLPAEPVMPPVVQPARTYVAFFGWDTDSLAPRAKDVIAEAAANSTHAQFTQIDVNGYTDTSGLRAYNQSLSIRRAKSVEAQLIADGVSSKAISIAGYGETHLLVPTGPDVREPQNRRVEILIK
jgi:OOP family OmpA-OmpF porin